MIQRVPCRECGAMILPTTSKVTGGLCMPCRRKQGPLMENDSSARCEVEPRLLMSGLSFELRSLQGGSLLLPYLMRRSMDAADRVASPLEEVYQEADQVAQRLGALCKLATESVNRMERADEAHARLVAVRGELDRVLWLVTKLERKCQARRSDCAAILGEHFDLVMRRHAELAHMLHHLRTWIPG